MRTTVTLESDVAAAVERLRRERSIGVSEAVNELIRAALVARRRRTLYKHRSQEIGLRIDVTNVSEAIELLEGPGSR
jgi:predicted transcriptional regulator